jgi:hypothetical protein
MMTHSAREKVSKTPANRNEINAGVTYIGMAYVRLSDPHLISPKKGIPFATNMIP